MLMILRARYRRTSRNSKLWEESTFSFSALVQRRAERRISRISNRDPGRITTTWQGLFRSPKVFLNITLPSLKSAERSLQNQTKQNVVRLDTFKRLVQQRSWAQDESCNR